MFSLLSGVSYFRKQSACTKVHREMSDFSSDHHTDTPLCTLLARTHINPKTQASRSQKSPLRHMSVNVVYKELKQRHQEQIWQHGCNSCSVSALQNTQSSSVSSFVDSVCIQRQQETLVCMRGQVLHSCTHTSHRTWTLGETYLDAVQW